MASLSVMACLDEDAELRWPIVTPDHLEIPEGDELAMARWPGAVMK